MVPLWNRLAKGTPSEIRKASATAVVADRCAAVCSILSRSRSCIEISFRLKYLSADKKSGGGIPHRKNVLVTRRLNLPVTNISQEFNKPTSDALRRHFGPRMEKFPLPWSPKDYLRIIRLFEHSVSTRWLHAKLLHLLICMIAFQSKSEMTKDSRSLVLSGTVFRVRSSVLQLASV
ncbi:hypothetical protein AVEN_130714-1 [Araneus ventricosus]|uniref:Uncharacterized protein n=1 Tax=Araneus ventricosus TaxID=182803 RepID=A0A4Y2F8J0_ARAVE|nr:hypothetical protein AVEN_130714-1 [Araneus ventricosus]